MKKYIYLALVLIIIIIVSVLLFKPKNNKVATDLGCKNKEHKISLTLQSGEKGIVFLTDNSCELRLNKNANDLSFKVLADGAIEDSLYQSKLYLWSRDNNMTIEEQIKKLINKFNKNKLCQVEKNNYPQRDGLETYSLKINHQINPDCLLFGPLSDLSSEIYMTVNGLLIAQRQDGSDGIEPFNLASISFTKE